MEDVNRIIDETDLEILRILQTNARTSNAEIARRVGMAPSAVLERIRKLESRGVVKGYEARLDPAALGYGLLAFVFVRASDRVGSTAVGEQLAKVPEVLEVHHVAGEDCYLVKLRVESPAALGGLLHESFGAIAHLQSTRSTIVLTTSKETGCLPLGEPSLAAAAGVTTDGAAGGDDD